MARSEESIKNQLSKVKINYIFPLGYFRGKVDPETYPIIQFIFERYAEGKSSMKVIAEEVCKKFNRKMDESNIRRTLHNTFYIGRVKYKGVVYPHKYPTFISEDLFKKAQKNILISHEKKGIHFERVKRGVLPLWQKHKLEKGEWVGSYPFGYKAIKGKRTKFTNNSRVEVDIEKAEIVKFIFSRYAIGAISILTMPKLVEAKFGIKITRSLVHRILYNKFYIGIMEWVGHVYKHKYPLFISEQEFNRAQAVLKTNTKYNMYSDIVKDNQLDIPPVSASIKLQTSSEFTIEEYMDTHSLSLDQAQATIIDMEIDGKIEEITPGRWRTIGV